MSTEVVVSRLTIFVKSLGSPILKLARLYFSNFDVDLILRMSYFNLSGSGKLCPKARGSSICGLLNFYSFFMPFSNRFLESVPE